MLNIVNQELVKAVSLNLCYNNIIITNFNVERKEVDSGLKDHIVISFGENMNIDECNQYLKSVKDKIVKKFCKDESYIERSFDKKFFPFNFDRGSFQIHESKYKYSVPIEEGVVFNLKCLLASGLTLDVTADMGKQFGVNYAKQNADHEEFDRRLYLYCMNFRVKHFRDSFIEGFSSKVKNYKNSPDDFLEIKDGSVYIKKGIFNNLMFIKEIQEDDACSITSDFQNTKLQDTKDFKDRMIEFINYKSDVSICASHITPSGFIILMVRDGTENIRVLNESEVNKINNAFEMKMLEITEKDNIPEEILVDDKVYSIDFFNPKISFSVVNGTMQSSVINKDYKLSIDPERVRAMQLSLQTPAPSKVEIDEPSEDSGFGNSPKRGSIKGKSRTRNSSIFLGTDYYGGNKGGGDASAKDSGFGASSQRSSARSLLNQPKTTFDQSSVSQPDQCSTKKRTSISKKSSCCIL